MTVDHDLIFAPVILFILFVAPLWLILHYRERSRRRDATTTVQSSAGTPELAATAVKMEKRITALEAVLDAESPGWRQRHDHE